MRMLRDPAGRIAPVRNAARIRRTSTSRTCITLTRRTPRDPVGRDADSRANLKLCSELVSIGEPSRLADLSQDEVPTVAALTRPRDIQERYIHGVPLEHSYVKSQLEHHYWSRTSDINLLYTLHLMCYRTLLFPGMNAMHTSFVEMARDSDHPNALLIASAYLLPHSHHGQSFGSFRCSTGSNKSSVPASTIWDYPTPWNSCIRNQRTFDSCSYKYQLFSATFSSPLTSSR